MVIKFKYDINPKFFMRIIYLSYGVGLWAIIMSMPRTNAFLTSLYLCSFILIGILSIMVLMQKNKTKAQIIIPSLSLLLIGLVLSSFI